MAPEAAGALVSAAYEWMARELGLVYQWATLFTLSFLAWLALGRHGTRVLGRTPEPEYGNASWMAMLFCAGIGGGLMYWSTIEWAFYVDQPPFGVEPGSLAAREWAATYGIFHWGALGVGPVRAADRRHRLALLPLRPAVPAFLRRPRGPLGPRLPGPAGRARRRLPAHHRHHRRHRHLARPDHADARGGGVAALRHRAVPRPDLGHHRGLRRPVRGQRVPGPRPRHQAPVQRQPRPRRRLPRLGPRRPAPPGSPSSSAPRRSA